MSNESVVAAMRFCLLILAIMATAACTVTYGTAVEQLAAESPCCTHFSELPYEPLPPDKVLLVNIDQSTPAFLFPSGKSYFKAFRLPELPVPYTVKIRSHALGDRIDRAHIFRPTMLILNRDFSVVAEIAPVLSVGRDYGGAVRENSWGLPVQLNGELAIEDANAKYLVALTTDKFLATSTYWSQSMSGLAAPAGPLGFGLQGAFTIRHSPFGRLAVEVTPRK